MPYSLQIIDVDSTIRKACITGDWDTAEARLKQRIVAGSADNNNNAYANLSFVKARKLDWDGALHDALKVR
jgi:hypothetical protein